VAWGSTAEPAMVPTRKPSMTAWITLIRPSSRMLMVIVSGRRRTHAPIQVSKEEVAVDDVLWRRAYFSLIGAVATSLRRCAQAFLSHQTPHNFLRYEDFLATQCGLYPTMAQNSLGVDSSVLRGASRLLSRNWRGQKNQGRYCVWRRLLRFD
jgi:hypothetical protein